MGPSAMLGLGARGWAELVSPTFPGLGIPLLQGGGTVTEGKTLAAQLSPCR